MGTATALLSSFFSQKSLKAISSLARSLSGAAEQAISHCLEPGLGRLGGGETDSRESDEGKRWRERETLLLELPVEIGTCKYPEAKPPPLVLAEPKVEIVCRALFISAMRREEWTYWGGGSH